jgi:hypothetical protein
MYGDRVHQPFENHCPLDLNQSFCRLYLLAKRVTVLVSDLFNRVANPPPAGSKLFQVIVRTSLTHTPAFVWTVNVNFEPWCGSLDFHGSIQKT